MKRNHCCMTRGRIGILWSLVALLLPSENAAAFSPSWRSTASTLNHRCVTFERRMLLDPTLASVVAGSVAGVVGSGVSLPLDKLKTRSQIVASSSVEPRSSSSPRLSLLASSPSLEVAMSWRNDTMFNVVPLPSLMVSPSRVPSPTVDLFQIAQDIWRTEGWQGFFSGCRTVMIGTGIHKAIAFTTNASMLELLRSHGFDSSSAVALLVAASTAGIVGSFVLAPMDRVKIALQTTGNSVYTSELECLSCLVRKDGWAGLMGRGLGATMIREVPSECIYFGLYGFLMSTTLAATLGPFAPLLCGATSGCASWIPVYPIDTVKTLRQNACSDNEDSSCWSIAQKLYEERGLEGFFDGISPRLLRAAVAHAITFYCYDLVMSLV